MRRCVPPCAAVCFGTHGMAESSASKFQPTLSRLSNIYLSHRARLISQLSHNCLSLVETFTAAFCFIYSYAPLARLETFYAAAD
jgi:hypothetical protein